MDVLRAVAIRLVCANHQSLLTRFDQVAVDAKSPARREVDDDEPSLLPDRHSGQGISTAGCRGDPQRVVAAMQKAWRPCQTGRPECPVGVACRQRGELLHGEELRRATGEIGRFEHYLAPLGLDLHANQALD